MVIESIIRPLRAEKRPWELFFYGILISSIGLFLGYWVFRDKADLVMIFLTVFAATPLMFHAVRTEEKKDVLSSTEKGLLAEHSKLIAFYIFLFIGMTTSLAIWYVLLPTDISSVIFQQQATTIAQINAPIAQTTGGATSNAVSSQVLLRIFSNNLKVLIFCIIFSFLYGAGAIFILTWNASVVAVAIGNLIKIGIKKYAATVGFAKAAAYLQTISFSFSRYFVHGLPEMIAYMIAGLAGGIISAAIINHHTQNEKFQKILFDVSALLTLSLAILFAAAIIESYVTPSLF
ncbi:stage II sporulation protein M [Candidatus Woesearchaeota archaeon]|nr:stage II sporulation protein M [Candidatus Woesearchaeota archaeon]